MTGKHFFGQHFYVFAVKVGVHNLSVGVVPFCHSEPTSTNDAQIAQTNRARPLEWQKRINLAPQVIENAPSNGEKPSKGEKPETMSPSKNSGAVYPVTVSIRPM